MNAHPVGFCNLDTVDTCAIKLVDKPANSESQKTPINRPANSDSQKTPINRPANSKSQKTPINRPVLWSQVVVKPDDLVELPKIPIPPQFRPVNPESHSVDQSSIEGNISCNCIFCKRTTGKAKLLETVNTYNCNWCNNEYYHDKWNCPKYVKKPNNTSCLFCFKEYGSENGHRQGTNCPAYHDLVFCHNCKGKRNHCTTHCIKKSHEAKEKDSPLFFSPK
jgi:hypothetical protein